MAGTLTVKILFGQRLSDKGADMFAKIKVGANHSVQTTVAEKSRSPIWNETYTFPLGPSDDTITVKVFKQKGLILNREELLGVATIDLAQIRQVQRQQVQATVLDDKKHAGSVTLDLVFVSSAPPDVPMPEKAAADLYPQVKAAQGSASLQAAAAAGHPTPAAPGYPAPAPAVYAPPPAAPAAATVVVASAPPVAPPPAPVTVVVAAPSLAPAPAVPAAAPPPGYPVAAPAPVAYVPVYAPYPGAPPPPAGMGAPYGYSAPPPGMASSSMTTVIQTESPSRRGGAAGAVVAGMVIGAGMERRHMRRVMRRL